MVVTEELRRMLDERGVEWWEGWDKDLTLFDGTNGVRWIADHVVGEWFIRSVLPITTEQVVAATMGDVDATAERRSDARTTTRHGKFRTKYGRSVPCCECCGYGIGDARWHYCPSCGAEVVE